MSGELRSAWVIAAGGELNNALGRGACAWEVLTDREHRPLNSGGAINLVEIEADPLMWCLYRVTRTRLILQCTIEIAEHQAAVESALSSDDVGELEHVFGGVLVRRDSRNHRVRSGGVIVVAWRVSDGLRQRDRCR